MYKSPIFPIFPSFEKDRLDFTSIKKYIDYLKDDGVKSFMTTAGSSQFNLLNNDEIRLFNKFCVENTRGFEMIIGLNANSLSNTKREIDWLNLNCEGDYKIMLLYPDRYYNDETIIEFFHELADYSEKEIWIHGMFMRRGNGGMYDYTSELINKISQHDNITGMKEETSEIGKAFSIVNNIDESFDVCVAGGSMKRHLFLSTSRDIRFLSGVGSIFPDIEMEYQESSLERKREIIKYYETPLFEVFMKIGWHASVRYALSYLGYINKNRKPFVELDNKSKQEIELIIDKIKKNYE